MLIDGLIDEYFYKEATQTNMLVIAGHEDTPIQFIRGSVIRDQGLTSSHEEADTIIAQHAIFSCKAGETVHVIADDTDIFVLLTHFYYVEKCAHPLFMISPVKDRPNIDIRLTSQKNADIAFDLLAIHGISGADTVAPLHGIGKGTAIKTARKKGKRLSHIGDEDAALDTVLREATEFIVACYGKSAGDATTLTECRIRMWKSKMASNATAPKLQALPPTSEAFLENIKRCHFQVSIWKSSLSGTPNAMDAVGYGWEKNNSGYLAPTTVAHGVKIVPESILKLIKCGCQSLACSSSQCRCVGANLPCTIFCSCDAGDICNNPLTKRNYNSDEED